jgi:hypothetical protein
MSIAATSTSVDVRIALAGTQMGSDLRRCLVSARVRHVMSRPSAAEILLHGDADLPAGLAPGDALEVRIGDELHVDGDVTSVHHHRDASGGHLVRIRGFDRLARLRRRQAVRALPVGGLSRIVEEIVGPVGLDVATSGSWPSLSHLDQFRDNDLSTLAGLADLYGAGLVVRGTTVHLIGPDGIGDTVELQLGADLTEVTQGEQDVPASGVRASAWDHERGEPIVVEGRAVGSARGTVADGETIRHLRDIGAPDPDAASAQARAVAEREIARSHTFEARATRRPDLRVGQMCVVRDLGGAEIGRHRLEIVDHMLTGAGLETELSSRAPDRSGRDRGADVVRGRVVDVVDPDGRGRIKVVLPTFGDAVTPWIDVVHPAGSGERGFVALPRVDDDVAVLVVEGELSRSIALGGLLATSGPASEVVGEGDVVRHAWHSDPDQFVILDSSARSVSIRNRDGSRLKLEPELFELHATSDLVIAAPGRRITIRAAAVDFEHVEEPGAEEEER